MSWRPCTKPGTGAKVTAAQACNRAVVLTWVPACARAPAACHRRCAEIRAATADRFHHKAALMHVAASTCEAVVLICLPGAANHDMAIAHVMRLDPASEGVPFERSQVGWRVQPRLPRPCSGPEI